MSEEWFLQLIIYIKYILIYIYKRQKNGGGCDISEGELGNEIGFPSLNTCFERVMKLIVGKKVVLSFRFEKWPNQTCIEIFGE